MSRAVGESWQRLDARDKVTGAAVYSGDMQIEGMLHLKIVFAGRPHAWIRGVDSSNALAVPGVEAVLTAADVPCNRYGISVRDRPVLCDDKVRHVGDPVAVVAAQTPELAEAAAALVRVDYEDLPVLDKPEKALQPGADLIHVDRPGNIAHSFSMVCGDVEAALARSAVVVCREYRTPMQEHAFLEPEAGLAYLDENGILTIVAAGQDVYEDRVQIAKTLRLPTERVRVIYPAIGGSFGGREELSMQTALALAAWKLRRPVKLCWTRRESIIGHHKRHAFLMHYKWGADAQGRLTAAKMDIITDAGAYCLSSDSVLNNLRFAACGAYEIPNVSLRAQAVYTNNIPAGAFRGFGSPQVNFAAEMQMNLIAEALGIDPISIRMRNCLRDGARFATRAAAPGGVSLPELIVSCALAMGAEKTPDGWRLPEATQNGERRRAWGLAIGMKNSGFGLGYPERSSARVELYGEAEIERAILYTGAAEVGQGAHTALAQICAEALGLPADKVFVEASDTSRTPPAGPASASRLTLFNGNAVKMAAEKALVEWREENRPAKGEACWVAPATTIPDPVTGECINSASMSYAAQAVEVEVDRETGQAVVQCIIAAHDPGRTVNPKQATGQIEGGAIQALGWTLIENFVAQSGFILSDRLSTYLIPTALDIPPVIKIEFIERPDPVGPFGVRGLGEIPFIPLAPAIASAIWRAVGVFSDHLPILPGWLWRQMHELDDRAAVSK